VKVSNSVTKIVLKIGLHNKKLILANYSFAWNNIFYPNNLSLYKNAAK
jgi:hypothetical protein